MARHHTFGLTDCYERLGNTIRFEVLQAHAQSSPAERLRVILTKAVTELQQMYDFRDVIYVVLNHPPITPRHGKRHFIAAINSISEETKMFLAANPGLRSGESSSENCEVILLDTARDNVTTQAVEQLWVKQWNEYWSITEQGLTRDDHTWNQLLLKPGTRPVPVGLCWSETAARSSRRAPYFQLPMSLAADIGLGCLVRPDSIQGLLSLPIERFEQEIAKGQDLRQLDPLRQFFDAIDQRGASKRTLERVAWKIFHLVRSYGVWGGKAFLSIPLVIGAAQLTHTAVLSLCTSRPLSAAQYRDWIRITGILLRPVLEEEMFRLLKQIDFAGAAYSIGHPLKSRTMPIVAAVRAIQDRLEEVDDASLRRDLEDLALKAHSSLNLLRDLGHLLDIATRCIGTGEREAVFLQKEEWYTRSHPYDLIERLQEIALRPLPLSCNQRVRVEQQKPNAAITIGFWIKLSTEQEECRPSDLFYDEILQELVINAARHANTTAKEPVTIKLDIRMIALPAGGDPFPAVVLSNECSDEAGATVVDLPMDEWFVYDSSSKGTEGGLPIMTTFMQSSNLGRGLIVHRSRAQGPFVYSVAIPLTGLQISPLKIPKPK